MRSAHSLVVEEEASLQALRSSSLVKREPGNESVKNEPSEGGYYYLPISSKMFDNQADPVQNINLLLSCWKLIDNGSLLFLQRPQVCTVNLLHPCVLLSNVSNVYRCIHRLRCDLFFRTNSPFINLDLQ